MLKQLQAECVIRGARKGETAKEFATRDPKAAKQLAEFIKANMPALVKSVAGVIK